MTVAVLGATGYTGQVLLRILATHPEVDAIIPVSSSQAGVSVFEADPGLAPPPTADRLPAPGNGTFSLGNGTFSLGNGTFSPGNGTFSLTNGRLVDIQAAYDAAVDVVFAALPHLASAELCAPFFGRCPIIDLSADFRLQDVEAFKAAYGQEPPRPDLLSAAVYGLAEWRTEAIRSAALIANPGCYPTATLLPLLPLARRGLIAGDVIVNALSGISGAGKKATTNLLFGERSENMNAYSPGRQHRHTVEIQSELAAAGVAGTTATGATSATEHPGVGSGGEPLTVFFTPHLIPVKQGMAVTTSVRLDWSRIPASAQSPAAVSELVHETLAAAYDRSPFVRITPSIPETRYVRNSNRCDISFHVDGDRLFLFSAIDNLLKGASGQAVQNMNIRMGFAETAGLRVHGEF